MISIPGACSVLVALCQSGLPSDKFFFGGFPPVKKKQRINFFNELLSGDWGTTYYGTLRTHKFRPVYGELKGVKLTTTKNRLSDNRVWEYSPATGAIKIGYNEYVGALVVNGTLAFIEDDGDQEFYSRISADIQKRYTLGDVKEIALNEKSTDKIRKSLASQFQRESYFYSFEFNEDIQFSDSLYGDGNSAPACVTAMMNYFK